MIGTLLQFEEATGEFDPVGTLILFVIIAASLYGARAAFLRSKSSGGAKRYGLLASAVFGGLLALLFVAAFVMNLAVAL
ncbi:hypothetical protein SAMN04487948_11864 [Halogranum amylolyticum]|uniref:Uncharacterized protein n=1 Tax=Halogranum amylolyticum TaxID=660520 RepID=A0A1H8VQ63_9EURY|nr:hypothetical protein [Halogranum amylolyticum]SEP17357.1 hypothetical protein SAMN04487948_11864 [Halogranum amylolyticum]